MNTIVNSIEPGEWLGICPEHGSQWIVLEVTTPGFTGALIYVTEYACGCQSIDDSADALEAAR